MINFITVCSNRYELSFFFQCETYDFLYFFDLSLMIKTRHAASYIVFKILHITLDFLN